MQAISSSPKFGLRLRHREVDTRPPRLDDFAPSAPSNSGDARPAFERLDTALEPLARDHAADVRAIRVPAPRGEPQSGPGRASHTRPARSRRMRLCAGFTLPVLLFALSAQAAPPSGGGLVPAPPTSTAPEDERPRPQVPTQKPATGEAPATAADTATESADSGPAVDTAAPSMTPTAAEPTPPPRPIVMPSTPQTEMVPDADLSMTGRAVWRGLKHREITLELADGQVLEGVLISQSARQLAVANAVDGRLVAVEKDQIVGVRVEGQKTLARPVNDGQGLIAGGAVLLGLGIPVAISGLVFGFIWPVAGVWFLPGPIAVGAWIPMVVVGSHRRTDYRRSLAGRISPNVRVTKRGGFGGLTLRF